MLSHDGSIRKFPLAIALLLLLLLPENAKCQQGILDSAFTFRAGTVKTDNALDIISRHTGYNFTYDSRLIDAEKKTELNFHSEKLGTILQKILDNDTLVFSVIDKYIIISRRPEPSIAVQDSSISKITSVSGKIYDEETGESLPYATIAITNKGKGTVTNFNGAFVLKISPDMFYDTLSVSFLGYKGRMIPVRQALGSELAISMKREYFPIPEIIIRNQIPQEIIAKVRHNIPRNYGDSPAYMTGFYREGVMRKSELQTYSEAILQIYKSPYTITLAGDQIKVFRSRKIENLDRKDTLAVRLKAGLSTCLELDGAKNLFDFISPESMNDYNYRMADIVRYDDESAYAIEFEQKPGVELPLFKGTIYINTDDFAILNSEFEINPRFIREMKNSFVTNAAGGFDTWPVSVKYSVSYRKMNDRYFLNHVRGDLIFTSKQKRKLFNTQFLVFFELAITEIDLNNVKRFDREEVAPVHSIFSETITNYDQQFWGDMDFLRPEENLIQALRNMNVKLREFSR
jgi:hypothetical protein